MKFFIQSVNFLTALFLLSFANECHAEGIEMADALRSNGKIYLVVGVLCIVFAGIILYLIRIEKKLKKLENQEKN